MLFLIPNFLFLQVIPILSVHIRKNAGYGRLMDGIWETGGWRMGYGSLEDGIWKAGGWDMGLGRCDMGGWRMGCGSLEDGIWEVGVVDFSCPAWRKLKLKLKLKLKGGS